MAIRVSPTEKNYTHHITLSDGVTTIGLTAVNSRGEPSIGAIRRSPYPKTTVRMNGGGGALAEDKPPYGEIGKSRWDSGAGVENAEQDMGGYYLGERAWTLAGDRVLVGPKVMRLRPGHYANEPWIANCHIGAQDLTGNTRWLAVKFTATESINLTARGVYVLLGTVPGVVPNYVVAQICDDNAGVPGTVLDSAYLYPRLGMERVGGEVQVTLTAGNDYWIVVYASSPTNYPRVGTLNSGMTVMESADGSTWSSSTVQPFVFGLVLDEIGEDDSIFAAWRWGLWWMLYSGAVVEVGWRGMATDNSADKKKLNDGGSPGWTTNEWAGAIVRIHGGPGAGEWRRIVSNDASSLTVDRDWVTTHTTSTEYVIVGGKNGRVIPASTTGMSAVQDVARGQNGILYVAQGDTHPIRKVRWNSGAYEYADDATGASFLLQTYDQEKGAVIWRAVNGGSGAVSMAPEGSWTNALSFGSEIGVGGTEMDITGMAVFDGKVAVLKSDSIWMVYNEVPDKLNLDLKAYSLRNGRRPVLMPPYLVFPYGRGVERLYKNLMEDFGPNRSLPMRYQGYFVDGDMLPGLLVMLCDAGDYEAGYRKIKGRSTVWGYRGGGWHALARLPEEIGTHALIAQPWDDGRVLCWVGSTHDVYYMVLPQAMNWLNDPAYITQFGTDAYAAFDAVLVSGWYYAGSKSRSKFWRSVRVFADNISTARQIHVYYQTAEDVSDEDVTRGDRWTYAGTATASNTKITLGVESVRLRLAFVLENGSSGGAQTGSPILYGYSLQYLARVDAADSWTVPFRGSDIAVERSGGRETLQADEAIAQLDTWARQITPLTMRSIWSPFDNKQVIIERPGVQPLWMEGRDAQAYYGSVTILEV